MKNTLLYGALVIVLFLIGFFIAQINSDEIQIVKRSQILLGTIVEIQVKSNDEQKAEDAITKAFAEVKRIDDLFTTYNQSSSVWKINNSLDSVIYVDSEIYDLIVLCDSVTKISENCFDVSLDNLIKIWGFDSGNPHLPKKDSIELALTKCCWKNIKIGEQNKIIKKNNVTLNFGAIAKGYAVDRAIDVISNAGFTNALVNAGGEIKVVGSEWIVGIQHPRKTNEILKKIKLENSSIATSGDYEQYFELDGIRYHHILNPKSGYPAKGLQSVTIINKSNAYADALATAVFVMGKEKGIKLIEQLENTEAMLVDNDGKIIYSNGFEKYLVK